MQAIIAIDVGTTGTKAALIDRGGRILASGYEGYETRTAGGVVEQEPGDWWAATCTALAQMWAAAPSVNPAAVSLSGQMQDLILLGEREALGPAILYADSRAVEEAAQLDAQFGYAKLAHITGNEQGPSSVLAKWLWLRRHDPARLDQARTLLLGAHDYVEWRLCGSRAADFTTASTTGLLDLEANRWADSLLEELGLDPGKLSPLQPAGAPVGAVASAAAEATGIPAGTPVHRGCGDLGATTVGAGAGLPGRAYGYLGTSGWIAASLNDATPKPDQGVFTLRHPDPARYIQVAPMLTAGGNLDWLRGALAEDDPLAYAELNRLARQAPAGSRGLIYLPYLGGERSPFSDPDARAAFIGVSGQTGRAEMVRAVMEGVAMGYRSLGDALGLAADGPLLLTGGGGKSAVWAQILADALGRPVQVMADPGNAGARGAAVIAGQALGWYDSYLPAEDFFPVAATYRPEPEHRAVYDELYALFAALYPRLKDAFPVLAAVGEDSSL